MKIVTSAEMREIDRITTEKFGVPSLTLMENAGSAVAEFTLPSYPKAKSFGVICGKGNNGGDGFVAARKLYQAGREVRLLLLADPSELRGDAAANFAKLPKDPSTFAIFNAWGEPAFREVFGCDVLIDAILGSGFHPPVSGVYAEAIAKINAAAAPVVAVDVPSGADADVMGHQTGTVARADTIVTFTAPRPAHVFGNLTSGPTVIAPIGTPPEAIQSSLNLQVITPREIALLLGPRPRDSNKGMYGHVLVVGGSLGKTGAAVMAGFSALRTGAGLVTVASPQSTLPVIASFHPELMTEPLSETEIASISKVALEEFERIAEKKTVLAIGPGISRHPSTEEFVRSVIEKSQVPTVLDADGLNAFEGRASDLNRRNRRGDTENAEKVPALVLTPHPGEMARLTGLGVAAIQRDRINVARSFAREHEVIVVLKGDRTAIAKPDGEVWVSTTGNPGMATGGTGDILTGIVAGMLAQNTKRDFLAVLAAVHLHGLTGDVAEEAIGEHSLVATDLIRALPEAFRRVRAQAAEKWVKIGDWRSPAA
ncbi:MAG: bifunctional ADP-dependent NAD(P)H-hydrate dehydratase/NAD(P)H-hydrate epimerase [Acidobacteria bacterium]|nr:MAG: bifunctional ADP-dependent NAD(P)H-hydrate dehydratase/NAD(P)H-hydrate epimerase [Acidobacteriota bacterium]